MWQQKTKSGKVKKVKTSGGECKEILSFSLFYSFIYNYQNVWGKNGKKNFFKMLFYTLVIKYIF